MSAQKFDLYSLAKYLYSIALLQRIQEECFTGTYIDPKSNNVWQTALSEKILSTGQKTDKKVESIVEKGFHEK